MPNFPDPNIVREVTDYLGRVLPNGTVSRIQASDDRLQLFILQSSYFIAGFGFSNEHLKESYALLYGEFKTQYSKHERDWGNKDLAFVICVPPKAPEIEAFSSKIETDVFFCRKFVVPVGSPVAASLSRLPFLPLTPLDGQSLRPASAQTFLQKCGVPALLARDLVVPHERSADGIVEDCLQEKFGKREPLSTAPNTQLTNTAPLATLKALKSITIENFRAYRKPQTFELGTDLTILYGPNGFGKTSFFDAIDFAVTGGIGRLHSSNDAHFEKAAAHLDSNPSQSTVSIVFKDGDQTLHTLERTVSTRRHALLDGESANRKSVLLEITGHDNPRADRVENFVSLFRASHLFSQEQQELTRNFKEDCRLSPEIVSRLLAFEDYANAVNKATTVRSILQNQVERANEDLSVFSSEIDKEKTDLKQLGRVKKNAPVPNALAAELSSLQKKITNIGIEVPPIADDYIETTRTWRGLLDSRSGEINSTIGKLTALSAEVIALPQMRSESSELDREILSKENLLREAEAKREKMELDLQGVEQRTAQVNANFRQRSTEIEAAQWVRQNRTAYRQFNEKYLEATKKYDAFSSSLQALNLRETTTEQQIIFSARLSKEAAEKLNAKRTQLSNAEKLRGAIPPWRAAKTRLAELSELKAATLASFDGMQSKERQLSLQLAEMSAHEQSLVQQISSVDRSQTELKKLLSQLQGHVSSGVCPLCGEDHGTTEHLIERIEGHTHIDAASESRSALSALRERAKHLSGQISVERERLAQARANIQQFDQEVSRQNIALSEFANTAQLVGVVLNESDRNIETRITNLIKRIQKEIEELGQQVQTSENEIKSAELVLIETRQQVAALNREFAEQRAVVSQIENELNRLKNDQRAIQFSLDADSAELDQGIAVVSDRFQAAKATLSAAQVEAAAIKSAMEALKKESASIRAQLQTLRSRHSTLQSKLTQTAARLKAAKLPEDATDKEILETISTLTQLNAAVVALINNATTLELAIDTATTAAALERIRQSIKQKELAIAEGYQKRDLYRSWSSYFDAVCKLLSTEQNRAIESFTRHYGPRTSVIQRRLRAVYGFDDIQIESSGSAIIVRVTRNGEELLPTDFFSQSQQQTLLLGLFLTACSTQNWSAFSPVFLDDPVTHFDDLNTYALLDLIAGLMDTDFGRRQFVISTCDEKLLQLAQRKFGYLRDGVKYYRFLSIGEDGPSVSQIQQ